MRNVFKVVSSVASTALLLSGAAMAGPPVPFGTWTVTGGVISETAVGTAPCGGGAITGNGFQQCELTIGTDRYIRTRIDAAGFRSEDFVRINAGGGSGLASTMTISEGTAFSTGADIMTGWATGNTNKTEATLKLALNAPATSATAFDNFTSTFEVKAITNAASVNEIATLNIGQLVQLGSSTDKQRFELRNVGADQVLWTAQSVTGTDPFSNTTSSGAVNASATNLNGTAVNTTVWTATFGAAPTF